MTAEPLRELGNLYLAQNDFDKAEKFILSSIKILEPYKHPDLYLCFESLATLYTKKAERAIQNNDLKQAKKFHKQSISYLKKAFKITKKTFTKDSVHTQKTLKNLSQAIQKYGTFIDQCYSYFLLHKLQSQCIRYDNASKI